MGGLLSNLSKAFAATNSRGENLFLGSFRGEQDRREQKKLEEEKRQQESAKTQALQDTLESQEMYASGQLEKFADPNLDPFAQLQESVGSWGKPAQPSAAPEGQAPQAPTQGAPVQPGVPTPEPKPMGSQVVMDQNGPQSAAPGTPQLPTVTTQPPGEPRAPQAAPQRGIGNIALPGDQAPPSPPLRSPRRQHAPLIRSWSNFGPSTNRSGNRCPKTSPRSRHAPTVIRLGNAA